MINITFYHFSDGSPKGFTLKGHSGFGESGNDIVCAAVSSAAYLTANTITDVCGIDAEVCAEDGLMTLTVKKSDRERARDTLSGFELHIKELQKQYPANVKITTEV